MMKGNNYLPFIVILMVLVVSIFVSGCIAQKPSPTNYLSPEDIPVIVGEGSAWYNLMPRSSAWYNVVTGSSDSQRPHISVPITIENRAGFDLNELKISKVEVIQGGKVVGDFKPWFQINFPGYNNTKECYSSSELEPKNFNLKSGCKLRFNIRANVKEDNTKGIDGKKPIKIWVLDSFDC